MWRHLTSCSIARNDRHTSNGCLCRIKVVKGTAMSACDVLLTCSFRSSRMLTPHLWISNGSRDSCANKQTSRLWTQNICCWYYFSVFYFFFKDRCNLFFPLTNSPVQIRQLCMSLCALQKTVLKIEPTITIRHSLITWLVETGCRVLLTTCLRTKSSYDVTSARCSSPSKPKMNKYHMKY